MPELSKSGFEKRSKRLRDALLDAQFELRKSRSASVALIVTGVPAAGRSETINKLHEWLNQKYVSVRAFDHPDPIDRRLPPMWRFWRTLPERGHIAVYFAGWYADAMPGKLHKRNKSAGQPAKRVFERICRLERMLIADRVIVIKIHLDVTAKTQSERLAQLRADRLTRWRVTPEDRWLAKHYKQSRVAMAECIKKTAQAVAPWQIVDGTDERNRILAVADALLKGLRKGLRVRPSEHYSWPELAPKRAAALPTLAPRSFTGSEYELELQRLQARFALLTRRPHFGKHAMVVVLEGMDAAGKGGAIRRLTYALDARQYQVVPVSAPSPQELAYPYLWRFWRAVPERGAITIFDRSWYGRVLVERVRCLTAIADWRRAYAEINEFELQLTEHGIIVQKFWLSVSKDAQLARFKERDANPLKRYKVDPEDWKNHRCYDAYQIAAKQMIHGTNTAAAPWAIVEADDKKYARLKVLRTLCEAVEQASA